MELGPGAAGSTGLDADVSGSGASAQSIVSLPVSHSVT